MARDALNMRQEVVSLCDQVERFGYRSSDGPEQITFGDLFKINELISSRFACILDSSRKHRLMDYPGTSLCKGKDDNVIISLSRKNREIQQYFCHTTHLLPNSTQGNLWIDIDCDRKVHYDWVTHVRQASLDTVSYHVQCHVAECHEVTQIWQTCFPFGTEEEVRTEAAKLMEPMAIFKLKSVIVNHPVIVCDPVQHFENIIVDTIKDIDQLVYNHADEKLSTDRYCTVTNMIRVDFKNCPENTQKKERKSINIEIRPQVRLYRKPSPSPPPQPSYRKYKAIEKVESQSMKFSTCTALYTPARPGYDTACPRYSSKYGASDMSSRYNTTGRTRSEFRERSVGGRSYVSLY